ncbi:MAG TPA: acetyl-CoA carboxylase carboxyltransferase subunit alpha [bacterium]|nr:acetyl-CoA carboxylase carboxyltransferase subunit alpha [bacterium]
MEKKYLEFEKPIEELDKKLERVECRKKERTSEQDTTERINLKQQLNGKIKEIFSNLTDWQIVQVARHPNRPHTLDYIENIFEDFVELHGDRCYADDTSIVAGFARFKGIPVGIVGHQKGRDTKENIFRKFGMAHPEGYKKALRIMKLGEKMHCPLISFIDTPGANPDIAAEERGQALTIANNLYEMSLLKTPVLAVVIGEGGSGGALGIGVADRLLMQQYSIYSVISPEGCASILWKSQTAVEEAAKALKLTANVLLDMGIADEIIPEAPGGAHRDWNETFSLMTESLDKNLRELKTINREELVELRYQKYRKTGVFSEGEINEET